MPVEFHDYSVEVKKALQERAIEYLETAGLVMQRQAANNTRVGFGQTAGKWDYIVDEGELECTVGNPLENAIWEELGTGEFAYYGNGRRGGWYYRDEKGKWHHTYGKTPTRALHNAFVTKKSAITNRFETIMREGMD